MLMRETVACGRWRREDEGDRGLRPWLCRVYAVVWKEVAVGLLPAAEEKKKIKGEGRCVWGAAGRTGRMRRKKISRPPLWRR
jgi:hypothetical protein